MIVNIRLEVTDEERNAFAQSIAGKPVKRLATRSEYVAALTDYAKTLSNAPESHETSEQGVATTQSEISDADLVSPAKQAIETPVSDRSPLSRTLEATNNAMFALATAKIRQPVTGPGSGIIAQALTKALEQVENARDQLVFLYGQEKHDD